MLQHFTKDQTRKVIYHLLKIEFFEVEFDLVWSSQPIETQSMLACKESSCFGTPVCWQAKHVGTHKACWPVFTLACKSH